MPGFECPHTDDDLEHIASAITVHDKSSDAHFKRCLQADLRAHLGIENQRKALNLARAISKSINGGHQPRPKSAMDKPGLHPATRGATGHHERVDAPPPPTPLHKLAT